MKKNMLSFAAQHKMLDFHRATTAWDTEVTLVKDTTIQDDCNT